MGAQFLDSVDHYATAQIESKWSAISGGVLNVIDPLLAEVVVEPGAGRLGTACLKITQDQDAFSGVYFSFADKKTILVGFAVQVSTIALDAPAPFLELHDTYPTVQVTFAISPTGFVQVYRGGLSGTLLGTTNQAITPNVYDYWEFAVTVDTAVGSIEVRKNGGTVLLLTGINTQQTANATANTVLLGRTRTTLFATTHTCRYDDIYILDGIGAPNALLGDIHVQALVPDGAGVITEWAPNGAVNNWACVDDIPPDDDTTYVSADTPTFTDLYTLPPLSGTPTVPLLQINLYARKDAGGTRQIQPIIRHGGVYYNVGNITSLGTVYNYARSLLPLDPVGAAWDISIVNADQFGMQEIS